MRVLIADDSINIRKVWMSMLTSLGHVVVAEAENGREAVSRCRFYKPDLVMLDMSMGDYGGELAAQDIITEGTATHVLMCTSRTSAREGFEAKGIPVLIKPIHQGTLEKKLAEITKEA